MKRITLPSLLTVALILSACGSSNSDKKKPIEEPLPDGNGVIVNIFTPYQGVWEQNGTGNVWQFEQETFTAYNYNSFGCVNTESISLEHIEEVITYLALNEAKDELTFTNNGTNPQHFSSLENLPDVCQPAKLLEQTDLATNFDFFWHSMNDYYAFFETRDIDWQAIYQQYRPQITASTTSLEFFEVLDEIMAQFGDGHLGLFNNDNLHATGEALNGFKLEVLRSAMVDMDDGYDQASKQLFLYNEEVIKSLLIDNTLHQYQNGNAIRWGELPNNLGYLRIDRVQNINETGEQEDSDNFLETLAMISQDLTDTDTVMQNALNDLNDSDALIIDLRFNEGGYDNVSLKIASYFNEQAQTIGSKKITNRIYQGDAYQLELNASPIQAYKKPIYVITGRSTGSGGEVLAMALKALPQTTMIGEPTNGSVSDVLSHTLPNGWSLTLSNEVYLDKDGKTVESIGITPNVTMPVYATQDILYGANTPIDYVMQQVSSNAQTSPSLLEVEAAFEQYFQPTKIPGIAVAVIKDDKIVYQKALGLANIEQNIPVTMDTPFNVGSISKTMLATGIMQKVEQGSISLDDKLTEMNLSFDANNPLNNGDGITLRHLVTHTSGIRDSLGYNCSYYVHNSNVSLYQMFGVDYCPEQATVDPTEFYANDYFNENGRYVMDGIYNPDELGLPDMEHKYSNVAAGLAGYAVEQKLGINFAQEMKQHIFEPLNLQNTAWHHQELSLHNPKATQYMLDEEFNAVELPEYSYPTFYDGDLNISANDLATFLITITQGGEYQGVQILSKQSVTDMLKSQTQVLNQRDEQGVFWYRLGAYIGHTGGDPGTNALMQYNTTTKTGLIVLMNGEDGYIGQGTNDELLIPLFSILYRYGLNQ